MTTKDKIEDLKLKNLIIRAQIILSGNRINGNKFKSLQDESYSNTTQVVELEHRLILEQRISKITKLKRNILENQR